MAKMLVAYVLVLIGFGHCASILWYDSQRCEGNWGQACYGISVDDNYCCGGISYQVAPGHWTSHATVKVATDAKDILGPEEMVPRLWDADVNSPCAYEVEVQHEDGLVLTTPDVRQEWCYYGVIDGVRQPVSGACVRWEPGNMIDRNQTELEQLRVVKQTNAVFFEHEA